MLQDGHFQPDTESENIILGYTALWLRLSRHQAKFVSWVCHLCLHVVREKRVLWETDCV